jgi:multidrug resistance efflux pump
MLNLSDNDNEVLVNPSDYKSFSTIYKAELGMKMLRFFVIVVFIGFLLLFMPWTQTIEGYGKITALYPNQKPQTINAIVGGRITEWYVREGQKVKKGDTLVHLAEVKDAYWDPALIERTKQQLQAKEASLIAYQNKIQFYDNQIAMINDGLAFKLEQAENKVQQGFMKVSADSADLKAVELDAQVALERLQRQEQLFKQGIVSLNDLETRKLKYRETQSKVIAQSNKLLQSRNELENAKIELNSLRAQYNKDLFKAQSEKQSAISDKLQAEAEVAKLKNQLANYELRQANYYILCPQDGYISELYKTGIGEIIKEGEALLSILPMDYQPVIEMFVSAYDIPLIIENAEVRIQFDGWPAFVFSGWPNASFGTFGGKIFTFDQLVNKEGKFRVLVVPDSTDQPWPSALKVGSGAITWTMLNDVPIWWELWRIFNGFPPDFYDNANNEKKDTKNKNKSNNDKNAKNKK